MSWSFVPHTTVSCGWCPIIIKQEREIVTSTPHPYMDVLDFVRRFRAEDHPFMDVLDFGVEDHKFLFVLTCLFVRPAGLHNNKNKYQTHNNSQSLYGRIRELWFL